MSLLEQIQADVKDAMKAGEKQRVHALRLVVNELQKAAKENGADELEVLQRERKRRFEAAEAYRDGGRTDLAEAEEQEAELIRGYMPEQLSDEELNAIVGDAVAESGATSPKEMGKVMALVMPQVKGRADGKRVSNAVKEKLTLQPRPRLAAPGRAWRRRTGSPMLRHRLTRTACQPRPVARHSVPELVGASTSAHAARASQRGGR
jgi:uncharacterized protein YqeY